MAEYSRRELVDQLFSMELLEGLTVSEVSVLDIMEILEGRFPRYASRFAAANRDLTCKQFDVVMREHGPWPRFVYPLFDAAENVGVLTREDALKKAVSLLEKQLMLEDSLVAPEVRDQIMFYSTLAEYTEEGAMDPRVAFQHLAEFSPFPSERIFKEFDSALRERYPQNEDYVVKLNERGAMEHYPKKSPSRFRNITEVMESHPRVFPLLVRKLVEQSEHNNFLCKAIIQKAADYILKECLLGKGDGVGRKVL